MNAEMRFRFHCIVALFMFSSPALCQAPSHSDSEQVRSLVENLVASDFNGLRPPPEADIIRLSPTVERRNVLRAGSMKLTAITMDADAIVVVKAYQIGEVRAHGSNATAKVLYERLALTQGYGYGAKNSNPREFVRDVNHEDIAIFELEKHEDRWVVVDPPLPRISIDTLLEFYKSQLSRYEGLRDRRKSDSTVENGYDSAINYTRDQLNALADILARDEQSGSAPAQTGK